MYAYYDWDPATGMGSGINTLIGDRNSCFSRRKGEDQERREEGKSGTRRKARSKESKLEPKLNFEKGRRKRIWSSTAAEDKRKQSEKDDRTGKHSFQKAKGRELEKAG